MQFRISFGTRRNYSSGSLVGELHYGQRAATTIQQRHFLSSATSSAAGINLRSSWPARIVLVRSKSCGSRWLGSHPVLGVLTSPGSTTTIHTRWEGRYSYYAILWLGNACRKKGAAEMRHPVDRSAASTNRVLLMIIHQNNPPFALFCSSRK